MSIPATHAVARGTVLVHSSPVALCPHIGWALETVLGQPVRLQWTPQPLGRTLLRTEFSWTGEPGTGARLASALRACENVRYEVIEEPSPGCDGSRWTHTPSLGIHHAWVSVSGDIVLNEDRVRAALAAADPAATRRHLEAALGSAWDAELEPFRHVGDGAPVRWLHRVS